FKTAIGDRVLSGAVPQDRATTALIQPQQPIGQHRQRTRRPVTSGPALRERGVLQSAVARPHLWRPEMSRKCPALSRLSNSSRRRVATADQYLTDRDRRLEMTDMTGGELVARALQAEGIEFVFGLPCPEIDPLLAQLEEHGIRLVPVRHEA